MSGRTQVKNKSKTAGKAGGRSTPGAKRKRGAHGDSLPDFTDEQDAFHENDIDRPSEDDGEDEQKETAEEKRLRLGGPLLMATMANGLPTHSLTQWLQPRDWSQLTLRRLPYGGLRANMSVS